MKIQVLGSGCPTCSRLNEAVQQIVKEMGIEAEVEYLTGMEGTSRIIELGAMKSPVLAIENQIVMVSFDGNLEKVKTIIEQFSVEE